MQTKENILQKKAMIIHFSFKCDSGKIKDARIKETIAEKYGADQKLISDSKQAIAKQCTEKIMQNKNEFQTSLYKYTLPHNHKGALILPTKFYQIIMELERKASTKHVELVNEYCNNYLDYIDQAKNQLNGLFNRADYKTVDKIRKKFGWNIDLTPYPVIDNFILDMAQSEVEEIKNNAQKNYTTMQEQATAGLWARIYSAVKALSEKMNEKRQVKGQDVTPIFRDSIIGNIRELVELLPGLNILDDPALETARQELENNLAGIEPEVLRSSEFTRQETAKKAESILNNIQGIF